MAPPTTHHAAFSVAKAWSRALEATSEFGDHSLETLPVVVDQAGVAMGDAVALISRDVRLTWREFSRLCNRYARWALARGVRVGDVVGLLMPNSPDYLAIWLGVTRVGGVVALLNNNLVGAALAHCVNVAVPKHLIVDASLLPAWLGARPRVHLEPAVWVAGASGANALDLSDMADGRLQRAERRPVTLSHKALLIYTSGTTGAPKAANVSHHRIMTWSRWFAGLLDIKSEDRMYDCLPLYHSVGGVVAAGAMLVAGGSIVLRDKFSVSQFWDEVVATECTLFQYIGELCRYLVNAPFSPAEQRHKLRLCCGNGLRRDIWERFQQRFRIPHIIEFYAATEGNFSLFNVEGEPGAIGRVPPFLTHRFPAALIALDAESGEPVRDSHGFCVRVGANEIGEAIGRVGLDGSGVGRFEGYTNASETEKKVLRNVFAAGDAWFRTGDLMRLDSRGFYRFVDRIGDTFRWKGENVSASEVEEVLTGCEGVLAAAVYGVLAPGYEGRAGMAAIVVAPEFDFERLHRRVEAHLPSYARPIFLRCCPELDMTGTFKQNHRRLAAEGYDPDIIGDALYFDDRAQGRYVPLNAQLAARIETGQLPL